MNSILSRKKAVAGIKIVESLRARDGHFFQNKRSAHRDLKWDYLDAGTAKKISAALSKARIAHAERRIMGRFGGGHSQIRLAAPLDFSLLEVRGRRIDPKQRAKERARQKRFREKVNRAINMMCALSPDRRGDGMKLTRIMRALKGRK